MPPTPLLFLLLVLLGLPGAAPAAAGSIDLEDCRIHAGPAYPGIKARCGILLRPLNPADDNSPMIDLHVAIVPALSLEPEPDPFVPIAGGPGQASTQFYASQAAAFERIRRKRDIVLIDQRGTGDSAALGCPLGDDPQALIEYSEEETLRLTRECLEQLPYDPRYFTTSVAVQDLEALRQELGYAQFNLYGVSYGSRVAQHFARRYPASTRSVILDGVVPPTLVLGPDIAREAQRALDSIFERCAESEACAGAFPNLADDFRALIDRLSDDGERVTLPDPLTGEPDTAVIRDEEVAGVIRLLSYHPSTIALIPLLLHEAANGNLQPLAAQYLVSSSAMADSLSIGMHNAVVCTEDLPYVDVSDEERGELDATYLGALLVDAMAAGCSVWPRGVMDDDFKEPLETDLPVLLLSGEADPITPPAYAERAMVNFSNAAHLIGKDQGHGLAPIGCVPRIMADFVASGSPAELDTACLGRLFAMPFFLNFAGPAP